jgi:hypothetical protein
MMASTKTPNGAGAGAVNGNGDRVSQIEFVSSVRADARPQVEALFYFNPRQKALIDQIRQTVEETGAPSIMGTERIWIGLPEGTTQCLFACDPLEQPIAVAIYCRPMAEVIRILHLAIEPALDVSKVTGDALAGAMIMRIRQIAGRIKGVQRVQLPYRPSCFLRVLH